MDLMLLDEEELSFPSTGMSNVPLWFSQGHIRDEVEEQEVAKKSNSKSSSSNSNSSKELKFLATGNKPELGMRTETTVYALDGTAFRMTGVITAIGDEPTEEELSQSNSLLWNILSEGNPLQTQTPKEKKAFISGFLGSVHGQRITSIATLRDPFSNNQGPVPNDAVVEISYKLDDHMYYPWVIESFRVLTQQDIEECSSPAHFFYEFFKGCICHRCNHKQAVTAAATSTASATATTTTTTTPSVSPTSTMMESTSVAMMQQQQQQRLIYCSPVYHHQPQPRSSNVNGNSMIF